MFLLKNSALDLLMNFLSYNKMQSIKNVPYHYALHIPMKRYIYVRLQMCTSGSHKSRDLLAKRRRSIGLLHKFTIVRFENKWLTARKYIRTEGERRHNQHKVDRFKNACENLRQLAKYDA